MVEITDINKKTRNTYEGLARLIRDYEALIGTDWKKFVNTAFLNPVLTTVHMGEKEAHVQTLPSFSQVFQIHCHFEEKMVGNQAAIEVTLSIVVSPDRSMFYRDGKMTGDICYLARTLINKGYGLKKV